MAFKLLPEKPGKYDKRVNPFVAICTDIKVQEGYGDDYKIVLEFGDEPILSINLKYNSWVEVDGNTTPKAGTTAYKFLSSFVKNGVELDLDVENFKIETSPSILGKELTFNCQSRTFESPDDGETKTYYIWTLKKIGGQETPKVEPKQKEAVQVDMGEVRKNWLKIVCSIENSPFSFANMVMAKGKFLQGKQFSDEEMTYYKEKAKDQFNALVNEGFITRNGNEYTLTMSKQEMIEAGLV